MWRSRSGKLRGAGLHQGLRTDSRAALRAASSGCKLRGWGNCSSQPPIRKSLRLSLNPFTEARSDMAKSCATDAKDHATLRVESACLLHLLQEAAVRHSGPPTCSQGYSSQIYTSLLMVDHKVTRSQGHKEVQAVAGSASYRSLLLFQRDARHEPFCEV